MTDTRFSASIAVVLMRASIMACKFGMALFIGRYLDLASLGLYGLAAGAVALGPVVIGLGLVHLIMREAVTMPVLQLVDVLRHYWCFTTCVYGTLLAITAALTLGLGLSELWILVVLIMLFEHLGNDVFQLQSNLERPLAANATAFIKGAAWVVVYVPLAIAAPGLRSLSVLFAFWLTGSIMALLLFLWTNRLWPWRDAFSLPFRLSWLTTRLRPALVIYVSDLSFVASQYIDRYLVTLFLGLKLAGVYFLCWSFANAASTFVSMAVLQVQRPLLIRAYHAGGAPLHRQFAARLVKSTAWSSIAFSAVLGVVFHMLLPLLDQPLVATYIPAFWLILAGMASRSMADFGAMALFTAHRDGLMTATNLVALLAMVLTQVLLMPIAGLYGAGTAILVTFAGTTLWRFAVVFGRSSPGMQPRRAPA